MIEAAKKLHGRDVSVFVIGIGNESQMNLKMMNEIATEPITKHIKYANTVEGINKVASKRLWRFFDKVNFSSKMRWRAKFATTFDRSKVATRRRWIWRSCLTDQILSKPIISKNSRRAFKKKKQKINSPDYGCSKFKIKSDAFWEN